MCLCECAHASASLFTVSRDKNEQTRERSSQKRRKPSSTKAYVSSLNEFRRTVLTHSVQQIRYTYVCSECSARKKARVLSLCLFVSVCDYLTVIWRSDKGRKLGQTGCGQFNEKKVGRDLVGREKGGEEGNQPAPKEDRMMCKEDGDKRTAVDSRLDFMQL